MTRIEFWSAVMGMLVAIVVMFNQANGRIDRLQAQTNARFDQMFDRMDRMQAENNRRFDQMFDRMDRMEALFNARLDAQQVENNRRFDAILETIVSFDRRVSRIEGRLNAQDAEAPAP